MAMRVMNNAGAMSALGQLKKNDTSLSKQLKKVASGMKVVGAGDGASEYSISERMRVRLRALGQDEENVQTGAMLLHVAEGGIQNQIDILKTIKQKVIDANNDTNTDADRATIQKEINQGYDQMQDIAVSTTYNGRRVLFGGTENEKITIWEVKDKAELAPDSDGMSIIPDKYDTLDGVKGPFDIFKEVSTEDATIPTLGLQASQNFSGATDGTADVYHVDFSGYTVDSLDGVGLNFRGDTFVLTKDTSKKFDTYATIVDISKCTTVGDVVNALAAKSYDYFTATANGQSLTLTTTAKGTATNNYSITGFSDPGGTKEVVTQAATNGHPGAAATGFFSPTKHLSGGVNQIGTKNSSDPDALYSPGQKASLKVDVSGVAADTGITVNCGNTKYIKFVAGNEGFKAPSDTSDYYTVGINASNASLSLSGMNVTYSGGVLQFTASSEGTYANSYSVSDGFPEQAKKDQKTAKVTYAPIKAYAGNVKNDNTGTDGDPATYTISLASVPDTTDAADLEAVIKDLRGKAIHQKPYSGYSYSYWSYEFIDSADTMSLASQTQTPSTPIDLNKLRSMTPPQTVREALSQLLCDTLTASQAVANPDGSVTIRSVNSFGAAANAERLTVDKGTLRSYEIDYGTWFQNHADEKIPDALYDKGFHFYCATDAKQWFNVVFTDGQPYEKDRPASGTDTEDIKTLQVDVSKVKNASDLVTAIYEQTMPILTGSDPNFNHHYRVAAEKDTGVLTIYDKRDYPVNDRTVYDYQEKGAKIADGIMDNVIKTKKDMLVDRVIIQHTDKSNMNIRLNLPRTTMDHIFQFIEGRHGISEYNVMTKKMREQLLGNPPEHKGILDKGIEYLTDANAVVGAQTNHLYFAHSNIKAQQEGTQSSESSIRDADMAKEMVDYTKANILAQSAQSMLAQANQSAGSVLNLLQ